MVTLSHAWMAAAPCSLGLRRSSSSFSIVGFEGELRGCPCLRMGKGKSSTQLSKFPVVQVDVELLKNGSKNSRARKGAVVLVHQGGSNKRGEIIVRAFETTLTSPSSGSGPQQQQKSLADITRADFPILHQDLNGKPLVYLDNAATSQKPAAVLNSLKEYYEQYNSNVHRGIHALSARATEQYEVARSRVAKFINSPSYQNVVFTRNASEAINLVAYSWALTNIRRGDEIVLSVAEHHSNLVPWQLIAEKTGAVLKFASLTGDERVDVDDLKSLISNRTKLVATHHISNALGSINPVEDIVDWAHKYGAKVLLDACQSVPHMSVDVQALDVDFLVASSHKMCGPTGIGFLYGKAEILEGMPPWMGTCATTASRSVKIHTESSLGQDHVVVLTYMDCLPPLVINSFILEDEGGGEMIADVYLDHSTFASPPARFEAGTPAIGEAIGFGAAIEYLSNVGMDRIHAYEMELSKYLYESLSGIPGLRIYGPTPGANGEERAALCSFNIEGIHPTDISTVLDMEHGVAVRSGHHCTQPLHRHLNINSSARASMYFYNTKEEVDVLIRGLQDSVDFFGSMHQ